MNQYKNRPDLNVSFKHDDPNIRSLIDELVGIRLREITYTTEDFDYDHSVSPTLTSGTDSKSDYESTSAESAVTVCYRGPQFAVGNRRQIVMQDLRQPRDVFDQVQHSTVYVDEFNVFQRPRKIPVGDYICHICFGKNHFIYDCPKARFEDAKTPYQGPKKCYGVFICPKCKRKWTSGNSFAQMQQDCKKCHISVYPVKQLKLDLAIERNLYIPKKMRIIKKENRI